MKRIAMSLAVIPLLGGCATLGQRGPVEAVDAEQVIRKIKQDLGNYAVYQAQAATEPPRANACGGQVNFTVESVGITLTTLTVVTTGGSVGVEIPIGGITLGPSGSYSNARESSQTLSFTLIPKLDENGATTKASPSQPEPGSFYSILKGLREAMLRASDARPCLTFPDEQDNKIEFGFNVTREQGVEGKISFLVFSLGAERKTSEAVGNAVSVSFVAKGTTVMFQPQ